MFANIPNKKIKSYSDRTCIYCHKIFVAPCRLMSHYRRKTPCVRRAPEDLVSAKSADHMEDRLIDLQSQISKIAQLIQQQISVTSETIRLFGEQIDGFPCSVPSNSYLFCQ